MNIITKIPDEPITKLITSYGRFVTKNIKLSTSQKIKDTGFYISAFKDRSDGFRTNSKYDLDGVDTKISHEFSKDIRIDLNFDYSHKNAEQPGSITWPTPDASQTDENFQAGLNLKIKDTLLKLYRHTSRIRYINPGSEDNTHKNYIDGIDLQHTLSIGSSNLLTAGVEFIEEKLDSTDNITPSNSVGKHSRTRKGFLLQDEISIFEKSILTFGARYDEIGSENKLSPKSSLLIKLPMQINITLSAGKGFRVPTMNSLYWPDTGWAAGNPNLKPEESTEYEAGIQKFFGDAGNIKLVGFVKKSENLIEWQEVTPGRWVPMNVSKAETRGIEAEGKFKLNKYADIGLSYMYLDPENITTGEKIRFSTRHQIKGSTSLRPWKDFTFSMEGRYVKNYVVQAGDAKCYFVLDGKISKKIKIYDKLKGELFIIGKNILDKQYQTVTDYPMMPRQFTGGLGFEF
ncbi:MAG: TonB-dependent receptor [Nitrospiraceae bacterium]|nr:TonB-dependent receptor [Nitrospiraceae bacterium]